MRSTILPPLGRNSLRWYDIIIILAVFLMASLASIPPIQNAENAQWNKFLLKLLTGQCTVAVFILCLAAFRFQNGISGFACRLTSIPRDIVRGIILLIISTGLVGSALIVTLTLCEICGYETIQKHLFLEKLAQNPDPYTILLLSLSAAVAAPVTEEFLFRGTIQPYIIKIISRLYLSPQTVTAPEEQENNAELPEPEWDHPNTRWLAILITAALFALVHADWQHWPALFIFGICLGYAAEKTGGLVTPHNHARPV